MPNLKKELEKAETILLDMDGVIYVEDSLIKGAKEAIGALREKDKSIIFLTNNSTKTREEFKDRLSNLGISTKKSEILNPAHATALYLSENFEEATCYVVGERGLKFEIEKAGFETVSREEVEKATHVIAGMDRKLTYNKIWGALTAIRSGADFIATNPDRTFPTKKGLIPGAGATIGAISGTTGKEPSMIIGKPYSYMVKASLNITGSSTNKTMIIGDKLDTDIRAGNREGLTSILVLTGVIGREDVQNVTKEEDKPDFVIDSLEDIID